MHVLDCCVSYPERVKFDRGQKSRPNFVLFYALVKVRGRLSETSESTFKGQPMGHKPLIYFSRPIFMVARFERLILRVGGSDLNQIWTICDL